MYNFKKLLCLILAVSTILSCFSVAVFADEAEGEDILLIAPAPDSATEETPAEAVEETIVEGTTEKPVIETIDFEKVSDEEALATMEKVAENDTLELYVAKKNPVAVVENEKVKETEGSEKDKELMDLEEGKYLNIAVKDKKSGAIWFTNPVNAKDDPYVAGSLKLQQQAQVWVTYVDGKNQSANANSTVASVNRGTYEIEEIENGIKVIYDFSREKESFKIPVAYTITDDHSFKAEVIVSEIDEYSKQRIMTISLVPDFGAGSINDEGYILVPDGSGAVIEFNNNQGHRTEFVRPVYGRDQSLVLSVDYTVMQPVELPVFGIKKNDAGYVAVIDGSDADVNASPSSTKRSAYNNAYASFEMRKKDSYTMGEGNWDAKMLSIIATMPFNSSNFSTEYFFLDKEDVSYSGMARRYRQYLVDELGFSKKTFEEDLPLFMEVYGAVTKNGNFLGMPTTDVVAMTSYDALAKILKEASELGIKNTVVDYVGWQKGGPNKDIPTKLKYENELGGKNGYKNLLAVANELGAKIFPRVEFVEVKGASNGYSQSTLVAKSVGRTPIKRFSYSLGSGTKAKDSKVEFYVSTRLFDEIFDKFEKNYNKLGLNTLSLDTVTNTVYSDYRTKEYYDINKQTEIVAENIKELKDSGITMLMNQPNDYALVYADYLANIPSFSSQFLITDYGVPFIQMVLHGWVPYSSPAISESGDIDEAFLKTIETGSNLLFRLTAEKTSQLRDSDYNFLYATDYSIWLDTAVEMYNKVNDVLGGLQNVEIQSHRRVSKDVFETVYADGTSIVVNYSDVDVDVDGRIVKAMSYDVKKGGNCPWQPKQ